MGQKYKEAETYLKDYLTGKLQSQVEWRKLELRYPYRRKEIDIGVKVDTSRRNDQLEQEVLKYIDDGSYVFLKNYLETLNNYWEHIKRVDNLTYRILVMFYRDDKTWAFISREVDYSESACRKKRNQAIEELATWL